MDMRRKKASKKSSSLLTHTHAHTHQKKKIVLQQQPTNQPTNQRTNNFAMRDTLLNYTSIREILYTFWNTGMSLDHELRHRKFVTEVGDEVDIHEMEALMMGQQRSSSTTTGSRRYKGQQRRSWWWCPSPRIGLYLVIGSITWIILAFATLLYLQGWTAYLAHWPITFQLSGPQ